MTALYDSSWLTPEAIRGVCAMLFGCEVDVGQVMAGEFAVNVVVYPTAEAPHREGPPGAVGSSGRATGQEPLKLVLKLEEVHSPADIAHQEWLCSVHAAAETLPCVASQYPSVDGQFLALTYLGSQRLSARLHQFMPGTLLADAAVTPTLAANLGQVSAQMVAALAAHPAEPGTPAHAWAFETTGDYVLQALRQVQRGLHDGNQLAPVGSPAARSQTTAADLELARQIATTFNCQVVPQLPAFPHQVVHQDLNDFNVFVAEDAVSGIIDFGDARYAPRIAEAAITATYLLISAGATAPPDQIGQQALAAYRSFIDSYREHSTQLGYAPSPAELAVILPAVLARMCLNTTLWTARSFDLDPESSAAAYGRARMARTWPVIRALSSLLAQTPTPSQ